MLILSILFTIFNETFNLFQLEPELFGDPYSHILKIRFSILFYGSIAGLILTIIERNDKILNFIKHKKCQITLNYWSFLMALYGLKYKNQDLVLQGSNAARIWSCVILFLVLGNEDFM